MSRRIAFVSLTYLCFGAGAVHAQEAGYEPSLPVPMPVEERLEMKRDGEYLSVARNGVLPKPFDARAVANSDLAPVSQAADRSLAETTLRTLPVGQDGYYIKAGAFRDFDNAARLHASLFAVGSAQIIHRAAQGQDFYGVYLGPWETQSQANAALTMATRQGMQDAQIVTSDQVR